MARASTNDSSGIELSLLEGMDERLLERMHRLGVRDREQLAQRIETPEGRRTLAGDLGVSRRRIDILHHLNFLLPEERAERLFDLDARVREETTGLEGEIRSLRTRLTLLAVAVILVGAVVYLLRPAARPADLTPLESRLDQLEDRVRVLDPLARTQAETRLQEALAGLGPAPGWSGPIRWSAEDHDWLVQAMGSDPASLPPRAVSVTLHRLADLEGANTETFGWVDRAQSAAGYLQDFPVPEGTPGPWEQAAVLIRERFRTRALGLAPPDSAPPDIRSAMPWTWTSPGFLTAEVLRAALRALPVSEAAFPRWVETTVDVREAAAAGGRDSRDRPEAGAQEVWWRGAELDLAVTAALLGRTTLAPYDRRSPRNFLVQRRGFVNAARSLAPPEARGPLSWLLVEYEEGLILAVWLEDHPEARAAIAGRSWVQALRELEALRQDAAPGPELRTRVNDALAASGIEPEGDAFRAERVRWEAGLRPLLMLTRGASTVRPAAPTPN